MLIWAIALQILLVAYHQVTTLVDFYPFNGVRFYKWRERLLEAGFNLALMTPSPVGFIFGWSWLMRFGVAYYFILLACECATWWLPYFFGGSPKWEEIYARVQGQTHSVLPRRGKNPAPNVEHLILMALTLATAIVTLWAYSALPGATFQGWWIGVLFGVVMVWGVVTQCCRVGTKKGQ